jgi:hypothetical protein
MRRVWLPSIARPMTVATILCLTLVLVPSVAIASQPGEMTRARGRYLTATLLLDGRVFIVGGDDWAFSADLYDPATRVFTRVGAIPGMDPRTAALLPDGRVLLTRGAALLFDPVTASFIPIGSRPDPLGPDPAAAVRLADGRVLIVGWNDYGDSAAELFHPPTGPFVPTGPPGDVRLRVTATLLADGRVLVVGGTVMDPRHAPSLPPIAHLYDPVTGTFATTGVMAEALDGHAATLLADDRVLLTGGSPTGTDGLFIVVGGRIAGPASSSAELFDPATGTFTPTGPMGVARGDHTATRLPDGRVLIAGGTSDGTSVATVDALASAELYDPATGTFTPTGTMNVARSNHEATLLPNGLVLLAGGRDQAGYLASAELYDPATGTFTLNQSLTSTSPSP